MMELRIEYRVVDKTGFGVYSRRLGPRGAMGPNEAAEILSELREKHKKRHFEIEARIVGDWRP